MAFGSALALYFVIWWITLFMVLPFGVRSQLEAGEVTEGSEPGAPASVRFARIAAINSVLAFVVLLAFWAIYVENVFNLTIINDITRR
jgi:predicted secreted protein